MKRGVIFSIFFLLVFSLFTPAHALTYTVPGGEINIDFPDDYIVVTNNTDENDPIFQEYNIDFDTISNFMEKYSISVNAISQNFLSDICVFVSESDADDYNLATSRERNKIMENAKDELSEYITVTDMEFYSHPSTDFLKIYGNGETDSDYYIIYTTCYCEARVSVVVSSSQPIDSSDEELYDSIIRSINFSGTPNYDKNSTNYGSTVERFVKLTLPTQYTVDESFITGNAVSVVVAVLTILTPILVYRFVIRSKPMESFFSMLVSGIYGVFMYFIINFMDICLYGDGRSLWITIILTIVNYIILSIRYKTKPSGHHLKQENSSYGTSSLKFHKFFSFVVIPISFVLHILFIVSLFLPDNSVFYSSMLIAFVEFEFVVVLVVSFVGSFGVKKYSWYTVIIYCVGKIAVDYVAVVISPLIFHGELLFSLILLTFHLSFLLPVSIYYKNRRSVFFTPKSKSFTSVSDAPIIEQNESTEFPSTVKFCRICGKSLADDSNFCSFCGSRVIK